MIAVVVLYALLALTFILAKEALLYANPCFLIGFRMVLAGAILLAYQYIFGKNKVAFQKDDYWLFFKTALFHIYFAFVLEFWALQYVSALKTTLIYSSTPFIAALLAYLLHNERLSLQKMSGIVIGLAGLIPVIMHASTGIESTLEVARISIPEVVLFSAVASAAYAWFLVKELLGKGYSLPQINGIAMFIGGGLSLLTSFAFEGVSQPVHNWLYFLAWTAALILVANILVYNMYGMLLRVYSITFITFCGFLCPCFGALYEWVFMGGTVSWHYFMSICLIALGLYVFYRDELKASQLRS